MTSRFDTSAGGPQGFSYKPLESQPLRYWADGTEASCGATHTACLSSTGSNPLADLREVMRHLRFKSICLLVHDDEENPLLYVHSMHPINEVLEASCFEKMKIQRQHVLFFMLQPPYNLPQLQAAFKLWVTQRQGFNAAVVHSPSDMLVVFANESLVEQVSECFNVALSWWGNVCPFVEFQTQDNVSVWVSGTWASIQELNTITKALVELQEPGIVRIEVDEGWSQLRIRPRSLDDVVRVRDAATNTLRDLGRRCAIKGNRIVLYQCAIPLSPFEVEMDVCTTSQAHSPALMACLASAESALKAREETFGEVFAYDVVMQILSQLKYEAILRHNYKYSFDVHGMKCVECVRLILEELFLDRPGRVGYTHIALNPTRNLLALHVPAEQRQGVQQHVQASLAALGMACTLIAEGPDLEPVDDPQALALYGTLTKKRPSRLGPATSTLGIRVRPDAVRCSSCAALLRSTLLRVVPGIVHVALDCNSPTMVVHYSCHEVTESEILNVVESVGYQPSTFYVPLNAAPQPSVVPLSPACSPTTPSTPHYFNNGSVGPKMLNGQRNPYALSQQVQSPTQQQWRDGGGSRPQRPMSAPPPQQVQTYSSCAETADGRAYPASSQPLPTTPTQNQVAGGVPWKTVPTLDATAPTVMEDGSTVLVFNARQNDGEAGATEAPTEMSISIPTRLRHRYTIWYDNVRNRVQLQQSGEADSTLMEVASFSTMPEFWHIWEHLNIESLEEGSILLVFRSDVPPDHNHAANKSGGRWFVRGVATDPRLKLWTKLVLAMLSEMLTASSDHEVCGVGLSVKPSGDRIEIWVDGGYHHQGEEQPTHDRESEQYLPNILTRLLGDELGHRRFHFWTHAGFERHRKSHRGSVRRAKRHSKLCENRDSMEEENMLEFGN